MKIGQIAPLYSVRLGQLQINLSPRESILNFTGYTFPESKYKLLATTLENTCSLKLIVSDSDRLAFDDLTSGLEELVSSGGQVLMFFNDQEKNVASKKRVVKAVKKLRAKGIKVHYCKDIESAQKWLTVKGFPKFDTNNTEEESAKLVQWKDTHLSLVVSA